MLFPQLHRWDKLKLRFSFGFKDFFIKFSLNEEKQKSQKMKQLSRYILKRCDVGTIEKPKSYVKDKTKMKWGIIPMDAGDMVLFFLQKEDLLFVLGGSPKHLIPKDNLPKLAKQNRSDLFNIMSSFKTLNTKPSLAIEKMETYGEREFFEGIQFIASESQLVEQDIGFLAKILVKTKYDIDERIKVIIGSPLYVAVV